MAVASGDDPFGDLGGLGALGDTTGGGDTPVPDPLPGDDWNDEARTQFVADCSSAGMAEQAAALGSDPTSLCGCVYDGMSTEMDFAAFNAEWASGDDVDPTSEFGQTYTNVILGCALTGAT